MNKKKLLSLLLILALVLSILPMTVSAHSQVFHLEARVDSDTRTRNTSFIPPLASGRYVRFIDRLASLPNYAWDLYEWLEDNASLNGALVNPEYATEYPGEGYYHLVTTVTGTEQFTYKYAYEVEDKASQVVSAVLEDEFDMFVGYTGAVWDAFDRDHPEVFWLSGKTSYGYTATYSYSGSGGVCTVEYEAQMLTWLLRSDFDVRDDKYNNYYAISTAMDLRDMAVSEILADCPDGTFYEQVCYLNDTLTTRNCYNSLVAKGVTYGVDSDAWSCISALDGRSGTVGPVCEAYSRAFKVLCDELQIPCVLVDGAAKSEAGAEGGGHMWNYVQLNGNWYAVDTTWNDPFVDSKPTDKVSGYENRDWLLLGSDTVVAPRLTFIQSHPEENNLRTGGPCYTNGPLLSRTDFDPNAVPKYSISGTVTSGNTDEVTVHLWKGNDLLASQTLSGKSPAYYFGDLDSAAYRLTVRKADHVSRSYDVSMAGGSVNLDLKIHLLGDIDGNGKVNTGDVAKVNGHIKGTNLITDEYQLLCANVNGGSLNMGDVAALYAHVRGTKKLY